jgi:hypothetical protein
MDERQEKRLTGRELYVLFDRLFLHGFAGADVLAEIAPEGWERAPLLACFHPSVEQLFDERVAIHRNLEEWRRLARRRKGSAALEPRPEPTLEDVRSEYEPSSVNVEEVPNWSDWFRTELRQASARAREEAMDRPPPATVRAYRQVYGRDPRGWPAA